VNPAELSAALLGVVREVAGSRGIDAQAEIGPEDVTLERPRNREHGDWA